MVYFEKIEVVVVVVVVVAAAVVVVVFLNSISGCKSAVGVFRHQHHAAIRVGV